MDGNKRGKLSVSVSIFSFVGNGFLGGYGTGLKRNRDRHTETDKCGLKAKNLG